MEMLSDKIKIFINDLDCDFSIGHDYGNGNGNGNGCGNGHGNSNGIGNGIGCGSGDGYGSGNGIGNGNGYGSGDCCNNGHGDGKGYGQGYGCYYVKGIKTINGHDLHIIDNTLTMITKVRNNIAKGFIVTRELQLRPCYIAKGEGYFAHGGTLRKACEELEYKIICNLDTDDKINLFKEKFKLNIKYPVKDFYEWHHKLTGSCAMGRDNFAEYNNIGVKNDKMTVQEFIKLTQNSFGGDVIKQLAKEMKVKIEN